jgi:hypothetical protein
MIEGVLWEVEPGIRRYLPRPRPPPATRRQHGSRFPEVIDPDEYQPAYFDGVEKLAVAWPEISPEFCGGKGFVV